jgi:hypothetical protein
MDTSLSWGAVVGGAFAGGLLLVSLARWTLVVIESWKSRQVASAALLHAGPWALLLFVLFAWQIASERWATSFFFGAISASAVLLLAGVSLSFSQRQPDHWLTRLVRLFLKSSASKYGYLAYLNISTFLILAVAVLVFGFEMPTLWAWVIMGVLAVIALNLSGWYMWTLNNPKPFKQGNEDARKVDKNAA